MTKISVIIPTYNQGSFLEKAIQSVINQTYIDWEMIVINNYSEDNTEEIFNSFDDKRIKMINYSNLGVISASRNIGIKNSSSEYVAFLDSDDSWYPDKLNDCIDFLENGYDLVCHSELWVELDKTSRQVNYGPASNATFKNLLLRGNCLSPSAVVVKRECLEMVNYFDEDINLITAEDYDLWLRISKKNYKIGFIDKVLGEFVIHENSNSGDIFKNTIATIRVIEKNITNSYAGKVNRFILTKYLKGCIYYQGSKRFWKRNDFLNAIYFNKYSIKSNPFHIKSYFFSLVICIFWINYCFSNLIFLKVGSK